MTFVSNPCGCLSIHSLKINVTYKLIKTFEKPTFLISYGIKNAGILISSGMHL